VMADLQQLPVEELAGLPDWLVPPSRKGEVSAFLAKKRREAQGLLTSEKETEPQIKPGDRIEDPRGYWEPRNKGTGTPAGCSAGVPGPPQVRQGPRGGRYTEDRTKDGRPYRRYF